MTASQQDWVDHLKSKPLPAMELTIKRLSNAIARPSSRNADYRHIVASDPAFALAIFRYLADLPKPPRAPIGTLSHALSLAGTSPLEKGVKTVPTIFAEDNINRNQWLLASYSRAVHAAAYLGHWGSVKKDQNPEELMLAALLHDCGEMALCHAVPEQITAMEAAIAQGSSREQAARARFGFTFTEFNRALAEAWLLPPLVHDSLATDGAFRTRSLGVMLACELARSSALDWGSEETMELIELAADYCRQSIDQTAAELHTLSADCARRLFDSNLPVTAIQLLQLQPRLGVETSKPTPTKSACTPIQAKQETAAKPEERPSPGSAEQTAPTQAVAAETAVQPDASVALQAHLAAVMKQLRDNAGLERCMFALLSPDRKTLSVRFIVGAQKDAAIKTFRVSLDRRHLFAVMMSKPQSFWLNPGNRAKFLPAIPQHLHRSLNLQGFFVSSLFIEEKPVGMLYADSDNQANLSEASYSFFKQKTQQLTNLLSNEAWLNQTSRDSDGSAAGTYYRHQPGS